MLREGRLLGHLFPQPLHSSLRFPKPDRAETLLPASPARPQTTVDLPFSFLRFKKNKKTIYSAQTKQMRWPHRRADEIQLAEMEPCCFPSTNILFICGVLIRGWHGERVSCYYFASCLNQHRWTFWGKPVVLRGCNRGSGSWAGSPHLPGDLDRWRLGRLWEKLRGWGGSHG